MNLFHRTQRFHQPSVSASRARRPRRQRLGLEALEDRQLLSLGLPDFVNSNPRNNEFQSANATNANGQSVVAWVDSSSSTDHNVFAQMFNPDGTKRGLQITVASSNLSHNEPAVAMDQFGAFVVVYTEGPDNNQTIVAKRYNNQGQQIGGQVADVSIGGPEFDPSVAMDPRGDFVITYTEEGSHPQVVGRFFNSSGNFAQPIIVDDVSSNNDSQANVTMDAFGDIAIVWTKQHFGVQEIDLARFFLDSTNTREILQGNGPVITPSSPPITNGFDRVSAPSVAVSGDGSMVIAYEFNDGGANGGSSSIGAQRFNIYSGAATGSPILIQANTANVVTHTSLALLSSGATDGAFVVAYGSNRLINRGAEVTVVNSVDNGGKIEEQDGLFFALNSDKVAVSSGVAGNFFVSYTAHDFNNSHNFNIIRQLGQPNGGPAAQNLALTSQIKPGHSATLSGQLVDDAGDRNLTLTVDWGDGSKPQQSQPGLQPFTVKHKYRRPGTYTVLATWTDSRGVSNSQELAIDVSRHPAQSGPGTARRHHA
jgi:hypothetical protein